MRSWGQDKGNEMLKVYGKNLNPVIEGLRGMGALMVLLHHYTYQLPSTWAIKVHGLHFFHSGVDLFFVITGYLFAPIILGYKKQSRMSFFIRRAFRLYPLYIISLLGSWAVIGFDAEGSAAQFIKHLLFLQTLPGTSLEMIKYFNEVYWTLCVEVSFYLFVLILISTSSNGSRPLVRLQILGGVSILLFVYSYKFGSISQTEEWILRQIQLPALLLEFWVGALIYYLSVSRVSTKGFFLVLFISGLSLLVALYFVYPSLVVSTITPRPFGVFNLLAAVAFSAILWSLLAFKDFVGKERSVLGRRVEQVCLTVGSLSYGIYLFHDVVLRLINKHSSSLASCPKILLATLITFFSAWIAYTYIEEPCRRLGRRLESIVARACKH